MVFLLVCVLKVNSERDITFLSFVPNIKIIHLEQHMKVLSLMIHYILWICVCVTIAFSCILNSLPLK